MSTSQIEQLEQWINAKEGESVEFKLAENHFSFTDLCKYVAAIANEGGGVLIFGVTDKRPRKVVGTTAFNQPERTRKGLCDQIPLAINFEEIAHPDCKSGSRVLVFHIPPRPLGIPMKYDGKYWMRKEDSLVPMSEDRLREIFSESGHDFSAVVCASAGIDDLDANAIDDFRKRWIERLDRAGDSDQASRVKGLTPSQLLTDVGALEESEVTYAALILFGSSKILTRVLPQCEVVLEYRSSNSAGAAQERHEYRKGFFAYYEDLWRQISLRNDQQELQQGLFVHSIATFSERSVREAVLNAVSHRNYEMGGSIFVRQFHRRLEIDSPGGFPYGINTENVLDRQNPRNRRVAEIFTRCGLVERSGQGMNLMFEESIRQSKPLPSFERSDQYQVGLTLFGNIESIEFVRFAEKISREKGQFFSTHDWLVFAQVARDGKVSKSLRPFVPKLVDLGLIERVGGSRLILAKKYYEHAGDAASYTRKRGLDREHNLALLEKHLIDHLDRGCKLEELTQVLPLLPESTVRSLLTTLRKRGKAHTKGATRSGRWFPGPEKQEETC